MGLVFLLVGRFKGHLLWKKLWIVEMKTLMKNYFCGVPLRMRLRNDFFKSLFMNGLKEFSISLH